jgi:lipopolysaccharide export system protein LptA
MMSTARSSRVPTVARPLALALILTLGIAAAGGALARQSDRDKPVNVSAQSADADAAPNGVSHLKGDVKITQGTLVVTGDNATVHFDRHSQVSRVVIEGRAHIQQQDDAGELMTGRADTIDYDVAGGIAVLTGAAHVDKAGRSSVSGDKLVYNTASSTMKAESRGDHRVHMVFQPRQAPAAAGTSAPAPASTTGQGQR